MDWDEGWRVQRPDWQAEEQDQSVKKWSVCHRDPAGSAASHSLVAADLSQVKFLPFSFSPLYLQGTFRRSEWTLSLVGRHVEHT